MENSNSMRSLFVLTVIFVSVQGSILNPYENAEIAEKLRRDAVSKQLAEETIKDSVLKREEAANEVKRIAREEAMAAELAKPF